MRNPVFVQKLQDSQVKSQSDIALFLNPQLVKMPLPMKLHDDPFFPFGRAIINATQKRVCAYVFDLASYLRLGAAGAIALERTIGYVSSDVVTILHGQFAGDGYVEIVEEDAFNVDAVTIADAADIDTYTYREDRAAFVVRKDSYSDEIASKFPCFWMDDDLLTIPASQNIIRMRLVGENVLYTSHGEDYAEAACTALEKLL